jgi:hypothetical protein
MLSVSSHVRSCRAKLTAKMSTYQFDTWFFTQHKALHEHIWGVGDHFVFACGGTTQAA